jgi:hypothetical protein
MPNQIIVPLDGTILKDSTEQKVLLLSDVDIFPLTDTQVQVNNGAGVEVATAKLLCNKLGAFKYLLPVDFERQAHPALTDYTSALAEVLRQFPGFDVESKVTVMTILPTLVGGTA